MRALHTYDESTDDLAAEIVSYSLDRIRMDPPPLDKPRTPDELRKAIGPTVTPEGIGGHEAFRRFVEHIAPATISIDHPRYLSFVPGAPTEAAALFDLIVGASSMYGGSWMEASGAVTPRTRPCAGSRTWPASPRAPAGRSSPVGRPAT